MNNALIWGAAGGLGRALVAQLAARGWNVCAVARDAAPLAGLTPHGFEADVADPFAVQQAVLAVAQEATDFRLWVYAAGDIAAHKAGEMTPETWRRLLDANLNGAFLATHFSLPLLAPDAHLIYLGAVHERLRLPGLAAYAAAKAGLEAFADSLRKEERGRRVTVVRPAAVDTPLWKKAPFRLPAGAVSADAAAEKIIAAHESGHAGLLEF